jgi:transmembrane sensor
MTAPDRPRAEREAIDWEVRLRGSASPEADADALHAWLTRAPEHAAAWAALQGRLGRMGGSAAPDARAVARALRTPDQERRRALRAGFGAAVLALGSWGGVRTFGLDADWRAGTGTRASGTLDDGSPLVLDAGSRIDLAADHDRPRLLVRRGQLLVHARGPLAVAIDGHTVETTGGRLSVGRVGRRGIIALGAGAATLRRPDGGAIELVPGRSVQLSDGMATPSVLSYNAATAWTHGVLVADRLPLPDLAEALGRYHHVVLRVEGAAAARTVSGVFPLDRLDAALRQVADALPVRVERYAGLVTVVS